MKTSEQGVAPGTRKRYSVVPRTLIFVTSINPGSGDEEMLLMQGAPTKRLWANKFNGVGGHVEPGEDFLAAAQRELAEETGLHTVPLALRGLLNIVVHPQGAVHPQGDAPNGVAVFVFTARTRHRDVAASREGSLHWVPVADVESLPLVDDLYQLLPLLRSSQGMVYGHYQPDEHGTMTYRFRS